MCLDGRVNCAFGSIGHSNFICTETHHEFNFIASRILVNLISNRRLEQEYSKFYYIGSHFGPPKKRPVSNFVLCITNPPICLYESIMHVTCCIECKYVMQIERVYLLTFCYLLRACTYIC
jgi:hypothetical protein